MLLLMSANLIVFAQSKDDSILMICAHADLKKILWTILLQV